MTKQDKFDAKLAEDMEAVRQAQIKPGSQAMENYLATGYGKIRTREHAKEIIDGWNKDHSYCPYELKEDALAYLAALDAKPSRKDIYHPATNSLGQVIQAESGRP